MDIVARTAQRRATRNGIIANLNLNRQIKPPSQGRICLQCRVLMKTTQRRLFTSDRRKSAANPADDPNFVSIVDNPPVLIKTGRRHGLGLVILALIPITAFALGTWQVQRLSWKSDLIARYEDRLLRDPLPLPPEIDPSAISEFDYRRVTAKGRFRHDQEMLVGPRLHDGTDGYLVVTPFERKDAVGRGSTILVCRGWISKAMKTQAARLKAGGAEALPEGSTEVMGLLRDPPKKNSFTPDNDPTNGNWYFSDVEEMAAYVGAAPVFIEETMEMELVEAYRRESRGIPIGRTPEVNLRNNHAQYIFTWYALGLATSVMMWLVVRRQPSRLAQHKVRKNNVW